MSDCSTQAGSNFQATMSDAAPPPADRSLMHLSTTGGRKLAPSDRVTSRCSVARAKTCGT